jgi:alpha-1,3-rhamnosyltransferase
MQNNTKPLVTVIVPSYNHEDFIEQTIESIVNQTYGFINVELIVIDDCSKDNTAKILQKLRKKYEFSFFENEVNLGVVKNLNSLLRIAKGKYIATCASDDYWSVDKLEEQVKVMESLSDEFAVCHTDAFIIDKNNKFLFFHDRGNAFQGTIMPKILIQNAIVAPSTLIRRKVFSDVGDFDEDISFEDREMWIRIALKYKFVHIDKPLVYRRQHLNNLSRDMSQWYQSYNAIFEKYYKYYKYYNLIKEYHHIMFTHLSGSNFQLSFTHMLKSKDFFFRKSSIRAIFKIFIPSQLFKSNIGLKFKSYIKSW